MSGPAGNPRPTYLLRLRPGRECRVPDAVALRRLLKALGRVYDLECVGAWDERQGSSETKREHAEAIG